MGRPGQAVRGLCVLGGQARWLCCRTGHVATDNDQMAKLEELCERRFQMSGEARVGRELSAAHRPPRRVLRCYMAAWGRREVRCSRWSNQGQADQKY